MDNDNPNEFDFESNPSLVTFLPEGYDDMTETQLTAYDEDGKEYILSSKVEPEIPVIVVGENERIIAVPKTDNANTRSVTPYYETDKYLYYMKIDDSSLVIEGGSGGSNTPKNKKRDSNDLEDYITKAKFKDQGALRHYEAWTNGRPEVRVDVIFMNDVLPTKTLHYNGDNNKGWWKGATKTLNSQIINWNKEAIGQYITYYWSEEDPGSNVDKTIAVMASLPNGTTTTVTKTIRAGKHDEEIGSSSVNYDDIIPSGGKQYDPSGVGNFYFWIDLK